MRERHSKDVCWTSWKSHFCFLTTEPQENPNREKKWKTPWHSSDTNKPLVCYRRKETDHQQILCIKVLTKWKSKTQKGNRKILLTFPYWMIPTGLTYPFLKDKPTKKKKLQASCFKNQISEKKVFLIKLLPFSYFLVPSTRKEKQKKCYKVSEARLKFCVSIHFIWKN